MNIDNSNNLTICLLQNLDHNAHIIHHRACSESLLDLKYVFQVFCECDMPGPFMAIFILQLPF